MCLLGLHLRWGISARRLSGALHGPHDMLISSRVSLTTPGRCLDWCFQWRSLPNSAQPTAEPCRRHLDAVHGPRGLSPSSSLPPFHGAHRASHGVANGKTTLSDRTTAFSRDIDASLSTTPGMLPRREGRGATPCTSAGRVTAHLLLSFLALSASPLAAAAAGDARAGAQLVLPIEASPIAPLVPEPPPPAEHSFVS